MMGIFSKIFGGSSSAESDREGSKQKPIIAENLSVFESEGEDKIYRIRGSAAPWGDYGHILIHGMTDHLGRSGEQLQLERTGPFVPPITFPGVGDIVVTQAMKEAMEQAGFRGIEFRKVIKARITEVDWHTWNLEVEDPKFYPKDGEPEGYILDKKHSRKLSDQLGDLWEVAVSHGAEIERIKVGRHQWELFYVPGTWMGADVFSSKCVSSRAKKWFEEHFPEWTSFEEFPMKRDDG